MVCTGIEKFSVVGTCMVGGVGPEFAGPHKACKESALDSTLHSRIRARSRASPGLTRTTAVGSKKAALTAECRVLAGEGQREPWQ